MKEAYERFPRSRYVKGDWSTSDTYFEVLSIDYRAETFDAIVCGEGFRNAEKWVGVDDIHTCVLGPADPLGEWLAYTPPVVDEPKADLYHQLTYDQRKAIFDDLAACLKGDGLTFAGDPLCWVSLDPLLSLLGLTDSRSRWELALAERRVSTT